MCFLLGDITHISINKVTRGDNLLARAVNSHKITETGMKAFLASVDPFHDKPISGLQGWPDLDSSPSVVRHWKESFTVSSLDAGGAIMVYSFPVANTVGVSRWNRLQNVYSTKSAPLSDVSTIAPVTITQFTAAEASAASLTFKQPLYRSNVNNFLIDGPSRMIGMGIEVRDVTADIYKQGTCTVFRVPQALNENNLLQIAAQSDMAASSCISNPINKYPQNLASMLLYPDTLQWEAREGAYVVIDHNSTDNDAQVAQYKSLTIPLSSAVVDFPSGSNNSQVYLSDYVPGTASSPWQQTPIQYMNCDSKGIYLTGLNAVSTFTITVCYYWETFPLQTSSLLPLSTPSADFDPKALALISLVNRELPVGCRICDNPSGEWFWEALGASLPTLGTVASAMFPEFAPIIAPVTGIATNAVNRRLEQSRKSSAQKKQEKQAVKKEVKKEIKAELGRR